MKVYVLEICFFCAVKWKRVVVEIKAINMDQLKEAFMAETANIKYRTQDELWQEAQCDIYTETLTFPIVNYK